MMPSIVRLSRFTGEEATAAFTETIFFDVSKYRTSESGNHHQLLRQINFSTTGWQEGC